MLMARLLRRPGAVGPLWDPLSLEHRLPRNLVRVIDLSVAPGSSPFRRIPKTLLNIAQDFVKNKRKNTALPTDEKALSGCKVP